MILKDVLIRCVVTAALACGLFKPALAQLVTGQPSPDSVIAPSYIDPSGEMTPTRDERIQRLREKVKHVFVIFNENHSFDNEFGTFPGANGLFATPAGRRDSASIGQWAQTYTDANGGLVTVRPFRIGPGENFHIHR